MEFGFLTLVIFFFALGGMIFVHELGHFLGARWAGIEVEEFGFGLPSYKLATLFTWQGTEFTIHALPLGGFVRPKGENDPNVPGGFGAANPWKRLVVLVAGPLMNLLTAIIVFSALIAYEGIAEPGEVLGKVGARRVERDEARRADLAEQEWNPGFGGPSQTRTGNLRIKSPLLYQLS